MNLDEPIFNTFAQFAAVAYPDRSLTDCLREAALAYMGTDPLDAARCAARRAAWLEAKVQIAQIIGGAMKKTAEAFRGDGEAARAELLGMIAADDAAKRAA